MVLGRFVTTPPIMRIDINIMIMHDAVECNGGGWVLLRRKSDTNITSKKRSQVGSCDTSWLWTLVGKALCGAKKKSAVPPGVGVGHTPGTGPGREGGGF